ncbi:MAG: hypothetical protein K8I82_30435, partial [Anaerolineae bacterium]|nr:hypothetical protein [Anaerolineae bacterium]
TMTRNVSKTKNHRRRWGRLCGAVLAAIIVMAAAGTSFVSAADGWAAGSPAYLQQQFKPNVDNNVSLFSGAATYSYPIAVPAGTHGMQPNISISYNSQGGNGWLGKGWDIGGLPTIERSTKHGVPKYNAGDTFVFGGDDLVLGSDGTYHTKTESFTKIVNVGGTGAGSYWEAWTKDGTYMRFGYSPSSRVNAVGKGGQVRVWTLDKMMDTNGNYLIILYTIDSANGDYYPSDIVYTINAKGAIAKYRYVKFFWASRTDVITSYGQGALVATDQRLDRIETYIGGFAASNRVNRYQMAYTTGSGGKSLLNSIKLYGTDNVTSLPATTFSYGGLGTGFNTPVDWAAQGNGLGIYDNGTQDHPGTQHALLDMNGDAMLDSVYRSNFIYGLPWPYKVA